MVTYKEQIHLNGAEPAAGGNPKSEKTEQEVKDYWEREKEVCFHWKLIVSGNITGNRHSQHMGRF